MNDKLISKEEEKKVLKRKNKFINLLNKMYLMFQDKAKDLIDSGIYKTILASSLKGLHVEL